MGKHDNINNRCPELQNILDSSFGFLVKWGTLFVIILISLGVLLSFEVDIREQQTFCAEYKNHKQKEDFWYTALFLKDKDININNGLDVIVQNGTFMCSGVVCSVECNHHGTIVLIRTLCALEEKTNNEYVLIFDKTSTLGEIIFSSIRDLL